MRDAERPKADRMERARGAPGTRPPPTPGGPSHGAWLDEDHALAHRLTALAFLNEEIVSCRACPRLVAYRERVAREKRRAYRDEIYWGRPVHGFGDPAARLLLLGLAPAAHGGNRTGRMFTGDRSGDFLFAALHRAGLASRPSSVAVGDGLELSGAYITASVRCAPPANKPSPAEIAGCAPFLRREAVLLPEVRVIVCLGSLAFRAALGLAAARGYAVPRPRPAFGHGVEVRLRRAPDEPGAISPAGGRGLPPGGSADLTLIGCYHPSQQNTFTGRLTPALIDRVLRRARALTGDDPSGGDRPKGFDARRAGSPRRRRRTTGASGRA